MDDQLNDDATCGSVDSNTQGINITPRVGIQRKSKIFYFSDFTSYQQQ